MTVNAELPQATAVPALSRLYFVRFGFAVIWAVLLVLAGSDLGVAAGVLLVLYPLFDVAAAVVDQRSSRSAVLILNIVFSSLAAVGLAAAAFSGIPAVLRVWGVWAVLAGAVQLVVGLRRRALGGQGAMIFAGGLSVIVGAFMLVSAGKNDPSLTNLAGYATLGGVTFLISALRLRRRA